MAKQGGALLRIILGLLLSSAFLLLSAAVIFSLAYLLGRPMLTVSLPGGETATHFSYAEWLNRYFPEVPNWNPQVGAGVSLRNGTAIAAPLLTVFLSRAGNFSIPQALRLISFLTLPGAALGIYLLGWSVSRRQTVGLIAAVLYLVAPISWTWVADGGLYSLSLGLVFLPLALVSFDRYLEHRMAQSSSGMRRIWLVAVVLSICAAFLTDLRVGAATVLGLGIFALFTLARRHQQAREAGFLRAIWALALPALIAILTLSFYVVPLSQYARIANREGLLPGGLDIGGAVESLQLIGIAPVDTSVSPLRIQLPLATTLFFLLGVILTGIFKRRVSNVFGAGILALGVVLLPPLATLLSRLPGGLSAFIGASSWLMLLMVVLPVGGAIGAWSLGWMILHPRANLGRNRGAKSMAVAWSTRGLQAVPASVLAIILVAVALPIFGGLSRVSARHVPYGARPEGLDLADVWGRGGAAESPGLLAQLDPRNWPPVVIASDRPAADEIVHLKTVIPEQATARLDVSPNLAEPWRTAAISLDGSQVGTSNPRLSLIQPGWSYEKNVLFSRELGVDEYGNPTSLNGLAKWFGIHYVLLDPQLDSTETYRSAGWSLVDQETSFQLWQSPEVTPLATLTSKPAVLVVEKPGRETYMTILRLANDGLLPYDEALLAEGRKNVDQYTLEELKPFDAILMVGYDYNNSRKAWDVLKAYVEQGGSLFVDTGWQYAVAEWEFDFSPDILPVSRLSWTDYGMGADYTLESEAIAGNINVSRFKPLNWEGQAWNLSGTSRDEVRDWGQVVLSFADRPLIVAGEYGKGRVVWSGMNLIGHAQYLGVNQDELQLFGNLIRWALRGKTGQDLTPPIAIRDHPDRVAISLGGASAEKTWLYWRESYYPDWHASISREGTPEAIPIYRGGPGFMLMPLEQVSENTLVTLAWEPSIAERIAPVLSLVGVALLIALTIDGLALDGNGFTWLKIAFFIWMPQPFLGEGYNLEWAEQKRAEIIAGRRKKGRDDLPSGDILHVAAPESREASQPPGTTGEIGRPLLESLPVEASIDEEEEMLLVSWLEKSGHQDDVWAEKLIGRKQSQVDPKTSTKR